MAINIESSEDIEKTIKETVESYAQYVDIAVAKQMKWLIGDIVEWESEGAYIKDLRGNVYLDAVAFGGVFGLGHRHPHVVAAVEEQLNRMPLSSKLTFNPLQAELAKLLASITPGKLQYCCILNSGTEAIEAALKLARISTNRCQIISTYNSYHGMSIAASTVSGIPYFREGFAPLLSECFHVPYGDFDAIEKTVTDKTAAILIEPVQSGSGCIIPSREYFLQIRELCDLRGILLIVDEIQTAFGRTGKMFAVEHFGVNPDIMCLGKFLGGGVMPIGCCIYTPEIQQAIKNRPFFNNTTFGGNQLACAAAIAAINTLIQENLVESAKKLGDYLGEKLQELRKKHAEFIREIRGIALMRTVVLSDARYAVIIMPEIVKKHKVLLLSYLHSPQMIRINPPLICSKKEIDKIIESIDCSLDYLKNMSKEEFKATIDKILDYFSD